MPHRVLYNSRDDIQDRLKNSILLSKNRWVKNSDCSIEVVFTEIEISEKSQGDYKLKTEGSERVLYMLGEYSRLHF